MPITTRLEELLNRSHVEYGRCVHPPAMTALQVAFEEAIAPNQMAKTVVFCSDQGYGMAVVPGDTCVDLSELRFLLGA